MNREVHVRFCERSRGKFRRPTRLINSRLVGCGQRVVWVAALSARATSLVVEQSVDGQIRYLAAADARTIACGASRVRPEKSRTWPEKRCVLRGAETTFAWGLVVMVVGFFY